MSQRYHEIDLWGTGYAAVGDLLEHNDYSRPSTNRPARIVIARKRPKSRLIRARVFVLCLGVVVILVSFVFLASGFPYSISTATWFPGLIGLTAMSVLLMLPVAWKALDEDLTRYRLARWQVIGGRKLLPYLGMGLALVIVMSTVTFW